MTVKNIKEIPKKIKFKLMIKAEKTLPGRMHGDISSNGVTRLSTAVWKRGRRVNEAATRKR